MMIIYDDVLVIPVCSCEYFQLIKIYLSSSARSNYHIRMMSSGSDHLRSLWSLISSLWLVHRRGYGVSHWSKLEVFKLWNDDVEMKSGRNADTSRWERQILRNFSFELKHFKAFLWMSWGRSLTSCSVLFHQWFLLKLWNFNVHSVWVMRSFPFIEWWRVFTFLDMILTQDSMDMCVDCGFNVCSKPHSMEIMKWYDMFLHKCAIIIIKYLSDIKQNKVFEEKNNHNAGKTGGSHQNFTTRMQKTLQATIKATSLIRSSSVLKHDIACPNNCG